MKFKSHVGKRVSVGGSVVIFREETYETDNEAEIKALHGAQDVELAMTKAEMKAAEAAAKKAQEDEEAKAKAEAEKLAKAEEEAKAKAEQDALDALKDKQ